MSTRPKPSVVIFAKSVPKLAHFYQEIAEMTVVNQDKNHIVLDHEGFQVVIHGIPKQIATQIHITKPPQVREETPIKLCLPVSGIDRARTKAKELCGKVGAKGKEWEARGFRACDGYDPEGNVFQVRESAA